MIFAWLGAKGFLGLAKWIWVLGAVAALLGAVVWLQARENADDKANREIGATVQREGDLRETITRTEEGNAAREKTRCIVDVGSGAELHAICVRTARTPANCDRYLLPERSQDQRGTCAGR